MDEAIGHIDRVLSSYLTMFGIKPKQTGTSSLEKGNHPELDATELLDTDDMK